MAGRAHAAEPHIDTAPRPFGAHLNRTGLIEAAQAHSALSPGPAAWAAAAA
ncbi:hypothetical protein [Streptomyces sp. PSAA01]|uniref:hypothetical protein n=1 Tax=Streptomyces sp. PSAA01 TaxID=2912762 RepID=UPI001F16AB2C|nr:hypothetical protein [Streptomyces sp. PSAA01]MCG0289675.1 hypothetical protein [Streptomyces sp. PSAA01]